MSELVRTWTLMFGLPVLVSVAAGCLSFASGILTRPLLVAAWFVAALLLQLSSTQLSLAWSLGLAAQSVLAIYLVIRLRLEA